MSISPIRVRRFAKRLLRENKKRSYRTIAKEDYPMVRSDGSRIVKAGTLNRIAKERGAYLPKDDEILIALGLKKKRKPRSKTKTVRERNAEIGISLLSILHSSG